MSGGDTMLSSPAEVEGAVIVFVFIFTSSPFVSAEFSCVDASRDVKRLVCVIVSRMFLPSCFFSISVLLSLIPPIMLFLSPSLSPLPLPLPLALFSFLSLCEGAAKTAGVKMAEGEGEISEVSVGGGCITVTG